MLIISPVLCGRTFYTVQRARHSRHGLAIALRQSRTKTPPSPFHVRAHCWAVMCLRTGAQCCHDSSPVKLPRAYTWFMHILYMQTEKARSNALVTIFSMYLHKRNVHSSPHTHTQVRVSVRQHNRVQLITQHECMELWSAVAMWWCTIKEGGGVKGEIDWGFEMAWVSRAPMTLRIMYIW